VVKSSDHLYSIVNQKESIPELPTYESHSAAPHSDLRLDVSLDHNIPRAEVISAIPDSQLVGAHEQTSF